ncbi:hypothetical protein [Spirillospora sp. NPDC029432]|uniref:hypothetical protein n=1 Tax=Spirillospora sp. NPDC029432 TaxID=3154599 RepID=UPI003454D262
MTTTTVTPAATATAPARRALGLLAPIGPLAMAGWALAVPYHVADEPADWIPAAASSMGRLQLSLWMLLLFALTAGAGAIVTGLVARRGSPRLGTAGLVLTFAGFSALSFGAAGHDAAAVGSRNAGLDTATSERILTEIGTFQAPTVGSGALVPLAFLGVLLLGIALWRGRQVPRWAAAALLASFPLILLGGLAAMPLNALGWLLLAAAFAAAGLAYARPAG